MEDALALCAGGSVGNQCSDARPPADFNGGRGDQPNDSRTQAFFYPALPEEIQAGTSDGGPPETRRKGGKTAVASTRKQKTKNFPFGPSDFH